MTSLLHMSLPTLIETVGYIGLAVIVFAESGLLIGFFLPGDSLLFATGILAAEHILSLSIVLPVLAIAAIVGDSTGYWFGTQVGPRLFTHDDSFLWNKKHILRAQTFYTRWGAQAVILGRLIPVVRTFIPILAGVGAMPYRTFLLYNIIGGVIWSVGITLIGYFIGTAVPQSQQLLLPISIAVVVLSVLPAIISLILHKRSNK